MKENKKIMMILGLFLLLNKFAYSESEVTSIEFKVKPGGGSQIRVLSDKNLQYQNQYQEDQKQVIIDIDDAKLGKMASRILDTSSFRSPVLMVSPYQLKDQNKKVRIVAQLRTNALAKVSQEQNVLLVDFDESFEIDDEFSFLDEPPLDQEAKDSTAESASSEQKDEFLDFNAPIDSAVGAVSSSGSVSSGSVSLNQPVVGTISPPTSSVTSTNIEAFEASQRTQNFQGRSITLKVHDSDVRDVLRLIGEASGFNIVIGDGVQGKITLSLEDVPWDQALNVVLNSMKLGAERNNNILRVMPLDALTQERISNIKAKAAAERSAPRVTRVFPISYAELASLKTVLEKFGSSKIAGDTSNDFIPATVELDERTNSLIVQDISDNIDRMARLIELLDTQTHQVLIEAKVVEASEEFVNSLSGNFGLHGERLNTPFSASVNSGATNFGVASGDSGSGVLSLIGSTTGASQGGAAFGLSSDISAIIPGVQRLNAFLSMSERENTSKTVASPRTVVLNKQTANILSTSPTVQRQVTVNQGVQTVSDNILEANTSLTVTPTVTNDEAVLMDLEIQRDIPRRLTEETGAIAKRNMKTKVLVESGSTLVIGGLYDFFKNKSSSGFPFLRKIPILGAFFGNNDESEIRTELFIFITPKVLTIENGVATL